MHSFARAVQVQYQTFERTKYERRVTEPITWTDELYEKVRELIAEGLTNREIAEKVGLTIWQVKGARARKQKPKRVPKHDHEHIRELRRQGLSYKAICREVHCGTETVRRALQGTSL